MTTSSGDRESGMRVNQGGRLVILSGPSGVGKSPLRWALAKLHPELWKRLHKLVLFNSRAPRPGERDGIDYYFRPRSDVEALRSSRRHAVLEVRGDLQAVDIEALTAMLERGDAFFEGNPFVGRMLQTHSLLATIEHLSIFLSPLSRDEIVYLKAPERHVALPELVTDVMRRKLLRRTRRQKNELSLPDVENIETRARSAYRELQEAWHFQYVIPNHDGEDSEHWEAFYYPIGEARKALDALAALLAGTDAPPYVERWEEGLVP
jgi:guanylate kinase